MTGSFKSHIPICALGIALSILPSAAISEPVETVAAANAIRNKTVQLPMIDGKDVRFQRLSTSDGLSQTRVAQIVQDGQGFLWFGTQYGLNRFDGYKFKVFAHDPSRPGSLGGVYITELFKDRSGVLWIGCDQFLDRFDRKTETFQHFRIDANDHDRDTSSLSIQHIHQDRSGMLWLSTGKGLYRFDPATTRITRYTHDANDATSIGSNDIKATGEDRSATFWVGHSNGLDRFNTRTGKVDLHVLLGESGIGMDFHQDRHGLFWIMFGDGGKLGVFDSKTRAITLYNRIEDDTATKKWNPVIAMLEDADGTMWFGTGADGLLKFDRENNRFIRYRNRPRDDRSLADNRVTALFQDREGSLWVGLHQAGPVHFSKRPPLFENPAEQAGQPVQKGLVSIIHPDSDGIVWLGTDGGALRRIDRKRGTASNFGATTGMSVLSMAETSPDILWMGTGGSGMLRYNRRTSQIKIYKNARSDPNSLSSDVIDKILVTREGTLWAATWDGLNRLDPSESKFHVFRPQANARGLNFHAIVEDTDGILWLGSNLGLYRFDPQTGVFVNFKNDLHDPQSLSDNRVNAIFFDHSGAMWVGTQNGLDRFDRTSQKFIAYSKQNGLAGNVVSCILEDSRHALWMSTNNGVSSFDSQRKQFKSYSVSDGLPGLDLTGWGACANTAAGEMFFGGFDGATAFYPENAADSSYVPRITLTDFRLFGAEPNLDPVTNSSSITLFHWQNFFSVEFSALSFTDAATNRYRYQLQGLDPGWIEAGSTARLASYTAVPPGTYRFFVQGATSRGSWSGPSLALQIRILPPWWSTWWFQSICLIAFALLIVFLHQLRLRQATDRLNVGFEARLAERTSIARDLHDTLLQSFHGLMLRFQAAHNLLPHRPADAQRSLGIAIDRAARAITESRDAVFKLRVNAAPEHDLISSLTSLGKDFAAEFQNSARFEVLVEGEARPLHALLKEDVYYISREAITNAFRHAHAKCIELDVRYSARMLQLRVRDDGVGIDKTFLEQAGRGGHWGLQGMRERAKGIGARFELWSRPNQGTEVELAIPAALAYQERE